MALTYRVCPETGACLYSGETMVTVQVEVDFLVIAGDYGQLEVEPDFDMRFLMAQLAGDAEEAATTEAVEED